MPEREGRSLLIAIPVYSPGRFGAEPLLFNHPQCDVTEPFPDAGTGMDKMHIRFPPYQLQGIFPELSA